MIFNRDFRPLASLALAVAVLGGCEDPAPEVTALERARAEMARGDALAAQATLERALGEGTPRDQLAAFFGEAALARGDLAEARSWLEPGKFSEDSRAVGFRLLGRLEMAQGNLAAAGAAFDRSYRVDPDSAALWVDIGRLRYLGGEQVEAIEAADRALALDSSNAEAWQFRGQLKRDAAGMEAGALMLEEALERQPGNVELRLEYAATLGDAGRAKEALQALRANDGAAAATPRGLFLQAVIAARGGKFGLAGDLLERSGLANEGIAAAQLLSATIELAKENHASAALTLGRLYRNQPDNRRVRDLLAYALSRSGGERELVERFGEIAVSNAGASYLRLLVGRAYETLGQRERAAEFLDRAALEVTTVSVLPSKTSLASLAASRQTGGQQVRDYLRAAIAGREAAAAVERAREFAKRHPGSADAMALLGDAEFARGDKRSARAAYERSANVRRPWPLALRLAEVQETPANARQLLESYVRNNPMNGAAAAMLADALATEGDWSRAVQLLDHAMGLGMVRVPWILAARSLGAIQLDDREGALEYALAAHELQPMNPFAITALILALPAEEVAAKAELEAKLKSLRAR